MKKAPVGPEAPTTTPGPVSIALRGWKGRPDSQPAVSPRKRRLPTWSTAPSRRSIGTSIWSRPPARRRAAPRPGTAAGAPPSRRRRKPRATAPAGARCRRSRPLRAPRSRPASPEPRADGRSAPRRPWRPTRPRTAPPANGPSPAWTPPRGAQVERLVQQQVVVERHRGIGHAHELAEDLLGPLGDSDVVAQRLRHFLHPVGARQNGHGQDRLRPVAVVLLDVTREQEVELLVGPSELDVCVYCHRVVTLEQRVEQLEHRIGSRAA